mgnify:FL=1
MIKSLKIASFVVGSALFATSAIAGPASTLTPGGPVASVMPSPLFAFATTTSEDSQVRFFNPQVRTITSITTSSRYGVAFLSIYENER